MISLEKVKQSYSDIAMQMHLSRCVERVYEDFIHLNMLIITLG